MRMRAIERLCQNLESPVFRQGRVQCRFQNTVSDLEDCYGAMLGCDEYYQSKADISEEELRALKRMIDVCEDIVNTAKDDGIVLLQEGIKVNDIEGGDDN